MLSKKEFKKIFSNSFYDKIVNESLVLNKKYYTKDEFKSDIEDVYNQIKTGKYTLSNPLERLYLHKSNFVARIITIFYPKEEMIYFYLIKMLEDEIAKNRTEGTYGGWRSGISIKDIEEDEYDYMEYFLSSYNINEAVREWKNFTKIIKYFLDSFNYQKVLFFDISNFYDNINLNILKRKLNKELSSDSKKYMKPLMEFLTKWNRDLQNLGPKKTGIPQTEFGDQSRLLANFYLQEYDKVINEICEDNSASYVRYADDQVILFNEGADIKYIMKKANEELNKIGLNINALKTKLLTKEEVEKYYLYDSFELLSLKKYNLSFDSFYNLYLENEDKVRKDTFVRAMLNKIYFKDFKILNDKNKKIMIKFLLNKDFILFNDIVYILRTYDVLNDKDKLLFLNNMRELLYEEHFNSFHYKYLRFFEKKGLELSEEDKEIIDIRLGEKV